MFSHLYSLFKKFRSFTDKEFNLEHLKQISQTGSVLSDEGYDFIFEEIKKDVYFNSISGGTDINGCFATGVPIFTITQK